MKRLLIFLMLVNTTNCFATSALNFSNLGVGGVTEVGTVDSQAQSADGAVISGSSIYMQSADGSSPGLLSAGTQTVAGVKSFTSSPILSSLTASRPLKLDGSNGVISTQINLISSNDVTGVLPVLSGGTGQSSYTDGQILIGRTSDNSLSKATITAGANITVTNGPGSITIASTGGGGGFTPEVAFASHGSDCLFDRNNSAYGSFSTDATCTFTAGTSSGLTVSAYLSAGDDLPGITFTPSAASQIYKVCASPQLLNNANDGAIRLHDGTNELSSVLFRTGAAAVTFGRPGNMCAYYPSVGTSAINIEIQGKGTGNINMSDTGSLGTSIIEWTVERIE